MGRYLSERDHTYQKRLNRQIETKLGLVNSAQAQRRRRVVSTPSSGVVPRTGRVSSATAAVISFNGDVLIPGVMQVWETIKREDILEFDEATDYVVGNFVWVGSTVKRANTTIAASAYVSGEWDNVPDTATYLIDRSKPTVEVPHQEIEEPVIGVLVKWIKQEVLWMSCSAPTGWE